MHVKYKGTLDKTSSLVFCFIDHKIIDVNEDYFLNYNEPFRINQCYVLNVLGEFIIDDDFIISKNSRVTILYNTTGKYFYKG